MATAHDFSRGQIRIERFLNGTGTSSRILRASLDLDLLDKNPPIGTEFVEVGIFHVKSEKRPIRIRSEKKHPSFLRLGNSRSNPMSAPKKSLYHVSIVRRTADANLALRDELIQNFQAVPDGKVTWKFESAETFGYVHEAIRKLPTPSFFWYFIRETKSVGEQPKFHTNETDLEFAQSKRLSKQPNVGWEYLLSRAEQTLERLEYRSPKPAVSHGD